MKTFFFSLFFSISLVSSINAVVDFDLETDQKILNCLASEEFANTTFDYTVYNEAYPIRFIHNPDRLSLYCTSSLFKEPLSEKIIAIADLPLEVANHIEKMIRKFSPSDADHILSLRGFSNADACALLKPVHIATTIDDPINNAELTRILSSSSFINEVLYYCLNNKYYRVRILFNPEGRSFSHTKDFALPSGKKYLNLKWNKKYAIAFDECAPDKLINYLSQYLNCSWRDWYFNFDVQNGTFVNYIEIKYTSADRYIETTYDLETYFSWMEGFVTPSTP